MKLNTDITSSAVPCFSLVFLTRLEAPWGQCTCLMCHLYCHGTWPSAWYSKCSINTSSLHAHSFMLLNCTLAWVLHMWALRSQKSAYTFGGYSALLHGPQLTFLDCFFYLCDPSSLCVIGTHPLSSLPCLFKLDLFGCHPQSRNTIPRADLGTISEWALLLKSSLSLKSVRAMWPWAPSLSFFFGKWEWCGGEK